MYSSDGYDVGALTRSFARFSVAEKKEYLEVSQIVFSQRTVSSAFQDGRTLSQLTQQLVEGQVTPEHIPTIRVVKYRGAWYALDNRRLRVFKDAFVEKIPVIICDLGDKAISKEFHQKRTNKTLDGGGAVQQMVVAPSYGRSAHFDEGSYVFAKKVLSWTFEQIQLPLSELMHTPNLPTIYSAYGSQQYFQGFLNLILEEARATLHAGLESLDKAEVVQLKFVKDKLSKNADNPSVITFQKETLTKQAYKSGDVVVLQNKKIPELRFIGMVSYLKENQNVEEKRIQIKVIMEEVFREYYSRASEGWTAQLLGSVITHSRMYEVCTQMPTVNFQQQLLTGELAQEQPVQPHSPFFRFLALRLQHVFEPIVIENTRINESQRRAIEKFMALDTGIQLVQGPPGTGKTTMTVTLLEELLKTNKRVLVCAPSNKAVQVIAERFFIACPNAPMILAGVEERIPEDSPLQIIFIHTWAQQLQDEFSQLSELVWDLLKQSNNLANIESRFLEIYQRIERYPFSFLPTLLDAKQRAMRALADLKGFFTYDPNPEEPAVILRAKMWLSNVSRIFTEISVLISKYALDDSKTGLEGQLLDCSKIVFSTLSVSGRKSFKEMNPVDVLVVDEAGQSVEAETLIPLVTKPKKCLLIGDTNQLPATVISQEAERRGYGRSLLFRLLEDCKQPYALLDVQYRMDPAISRWPSLRYYEGKIKDDGSVTVPREDIFVTQGELPRFICPYAFINVSGKEEQSYGQSYLNKAEAEYIGWMLGYLKNQLRVDLVARVGIITFYKGQSDFLQKQLKGKFGEIKIQTVDSFQGSENDIIIISFVRANERNQVGFLKDFRRLNVALTRAKYSLIMFGHAMTLMKGVKDLGHLIGDAQQRGCFFSGEAVKQMICPPKPVVAAKTFAPARKTRVPAKSKSQPCKFFNGHPKSCRKGESCTFLHQMKNKR